MGQLLKIPGIAWGCKFKQQAWIKSSKNKTLFTVGYCLKPKLQGDIP